MLLVDGPATVVLVAVVVADAEVAAAVVVLAEEHLVGSGYLLISDERSVISRCFNFSKAS